MKSNFRITDKKLLFLRFRNDFGNIFQKISFQFRIFIAEISLFLKLIMQKINPEVIFKVFIRLA